MNRALPLLLLIAALVGGIYFLANSDPAVDPKANSEQTQGGSDDLSGADAAAQQAGKSAADGGESREAVVSPGSVSNPSAVSAGAASITLRGRLVTSDGQPQAGALLLDVQPFGVDEIGRVDLPNQKMGPPVKASAGADGRFEVPMPPGKTGTLRLVGEDLMLRGRNGSLAVESGAVDQDLGDLEVLRAASIAGRVVAGGRGIPKVEVSQIGKGGLFDLLGGGGAITDDEGRFELKRLLPGKIKIGTRSSEFLPAELELTVAQGQRREDVLIKLRQGGVIEGRVVDDRGVAIAGATVSASRKRQLDPGIEMRGFSAGESTETDGGGNFRLAGLANPTVELRATKDGHSVATARDIKAGTTNTVLKLPRLGAVHGQLVDEAGQPIAGSKVSARLAGQGHSFLMTLQNSEVETDAEGRFVLPEVGQGRNEIVASGEGHLDAKGFAEVRSGEATKDVQLVAARGATLTVTVRDTKGMPVAGATVSASRVLAGGLGGLSMGTGSSGRSVRRVARRGSANTEAGERAVARILGDAQLLGTAKTNAEGEAVLRGMAPGEVELAAAHAELAAAGTEKVTIPEGGDAAAQLSMQRGGAVQVSVVDGGGEPLSGAGFLVKGPLGGGEPNTDEHQADAQGVRRVGPLVPGAYEAVLTKKPTINQISSGMSFSVAGDKPELKDTVVAFSVEADGVATVRLVMPVLTTVSGTVSDAKGPVAGAEIDVLGENEVRLPMLAGNRAITDEQGRFEIPGLTSGSYRLTFQRRGAVVPGEKKIDLVKNQPTSVHELQIPGGVVKLKVQDDAEGFGVDEAKVSLQRYREPKAGGPTAAPARPRRMMMISMTASSGSGRSTAPTSINMTVGGDAKVETDGKGLAELVDVPAGKFTLTVEHKDYATFTKVITVAEGEVKNLGAVRIHEGCKVRGRVNVPKSGGLEIATVQIRGDGGYEDTTVQTQGSFAFTGLKAGTYRVRARGVGGGEWGPEKTVVIDPDEAGRVTLELPKK